MLLEPDGDADDGDVIDGSSEVGSPMDDTGRPGSAGRSASRGGKTPSPSRGGKTPSPSPKPSPTGGIARQETEEGDVPSAESLLTECENALNECLRRDQFGHRPRLLLAALAWSHGKRLSEARKHCEILLKKSGGKKANFVWYMWQHTGIAEPVFGRAAKEESADGDDLSRRSYHLHADCMCVAKLYAELLHQEALPSSATQATSKKDDGAKELPILRTLTDHLQVEGMPELRRLSMLCYLDALARLIDANANAGQPSESTGASTAASPIRQSTPAKKPSHSAATVEKLKELLRRAFEVQQDAEFSKLLSTGSNQNEKRTTADELLQVAYKSYHTVYEAQSKAQEAREAKKEQKEQAAAASDGAPSVEASPVRASKTTSAGGAASHALPPVESSAADIATFCSVEFPQEAANSKNKPGAKLKLTKGGANKPQPAQPQQQQGLTSAAFAAAVAAPTSGGPPQQVSPQRAAAQQMAAHMYQQMGGYVQQHVMPPQQGGGYVQQLPPRPGMMPQQGYAPQQMAPRPLYANMQMPPQMFPPRPGMPPPQLMQQMPQQQQAAPTPQPGTAAAPAAAHFVEDID